MLLRIALFTLLALGIAGFGGVAWVSLRGSAPAVQAASAPPARVTLLVAAHGLQAGNLLKPDDVGTREFSAAAVPDGAWTDTPEARTALLGAMVRRSLLANEPLLPRRRAAPRRSRLPRRGARPGHARRHRRRRCG